MMTRDESIQVRLERSAAPSGDAVVLELAGELDLAVADRFHQLVDEVLAERPALVVADVSEVGFLDSTMLRELLRAHRQAGEAGGRLVLAGAQPSVLRLLDLTATAEVFDLAESREAAIASSG